MRHIRQRRWSSLPGAYRLVLGGLWLLLCLALSGAGCSRSGASSEQQETHHSSHAPVDISPTVQETVSQTDRELWYINDVLGERVGYERIVIRRVAVDGTTYRELQGESRMTIKRMGTPVEVTARYTSRETLQGRPLEFTVELLQGQTKMLTRGRLQGDLMAVEMEVAGRTMKHSFPLPENCRGLLGLQDVLWEKPLQPGQEQQFETLMVGMVGVCRMQIKAAQRETVSLPDGPRQLLRVDTITTLPQDITLRGAVWVDETGLIIKQQTDSPPMTAVLSSREEVLRAHFGAALDLVEDIRIPAVVPGNLEKAQQAVYLVSGLIDATEAPFADGTNQVVNRRPEGSWEIVVRPRRVAGDPSSCGETATAEERQANLWIQSDAASVLGLAEAVTKGLSNHREIALALERSVFQYVKNRGYNHAFLSAADVLQSREGDCTEHAVLLAALARAKGIPARVAVGLVHQNDAFYYHMWTELLIDGCWIGLDATRGRGGIHPGYIKLGHSALAGPDAMTAFLPILKVLGQIKIQVLAVE